MKRNTATTIGANSRHPKNTSCVERFCNSPSAVSANRKQVLRYTARVATTSAATKLLLIVVGLFLALTKVQKRTTRNTANENTWNARPASKMLFGVVGSSWLEYATPTRAAPAIWMIVAATSQTMKIQRMSFGGIGAYCLP